MSEFKELDDIDALVRRVDPDRWLASRFIADAQARADVIALYAFNYELARVAESVSNPLMGEIRLTWWSEAVAEIFAGAPVRRHPVVEALAMAVRRRGLPREPLETMVEARFADFDAEPFADEAAVLAYLDATAGGLAKLAAATLGAESAEITSAARAWGLAGLMRLGRLPANAETRDRVRSALRAARPGVSAMPVVAFPAISYVTLSNAYAACRNLSDLEKRLRLVIATATGRL